MNKLDTNILKKILMLIELEGWLWNKGVLGAKKDVMGVAQYNVHLTETLFDNVSKDKTIVVDPEYVDDYERHSFIDDDGIQYFCLKDRVDFNGVGLS